MKHFDDELRKLYEVLDASFRHFFGFTHLSYAEFETLWCSTRYAFHPSLATFIHDGEGHLVGFAGAFLALGDAVRATRGESNVLAKARFLLRRRRVERILFYLGGMTPEEQAKRSGLGRAGFHYIIRQIIDTGYDRVVVALMAERNPVRGLLRGRTADADREYVLFGMRL